MANYILADHLSENLEDGFHLIDQPDLDESADSIDLAEEFATYLVEVAPSGAPFIGRMPEPYSLAREETVLRQQIANASPAEKAAGYLSDGTLIPLDFNED